MKNYKKNTFCREFNSGYQLWVLLQRRHCNVILNVKYSDIAVESIFREELRSLSMDKKDLAQMLFTLRCIQSLVTSALRDQQYIA